MALIVRHSEDDYFNIIVLLVNKTANGTGADGVTEFIQPWLIRVGINTHTANFLPTLASAITFFTLLHVSYLPTFTEGGISHLAS